MPQLNDNIQILDEKWYCNVTSPPSRIPLIHELLTKLRPLLPSFRERFGRTPIGTAHDLATFVRTRAAFIAQTTLYGYLKTRMGTSFRYFFEDDRYSASIRIATVKLFTACAADLAIFAAATAAQGSVLDDTEAAALAEFCFRESLAQGIAEVDADHVPTGAFERFAMRAAAAPWHAAAQGEFAFAESPDALIRYAPVVDEFKDLDREIVRNSIRFRWLDVRATLRRRMTPEAVCADWRARSWLRPSTSGGSTS